MKRNFEKNLCEGSIFPMLITYAVPLFATNILQVLLNATDIAMLGILLGEQGDTAVAAIGSTAALINLIVGLFVGVSVATNVLVARAVGQNDPERAHRIVGMSVLIGGIFGCVLLLIGVFFSRTFLEWMACDPKVIDMATTYMRIYFLSMPLMMVYNFAAAVLRAVGDTTRPLIFLCIGSACNVALNFVFIQVFHTTVEGVAIATVISQLIYVVLSLITLCRGRGYARLERRHLRIYGKDFGEMLRIGLPSGLQGCVFSLSNVLIQSSINTFGEYAIAGNTIGGQFDGVIYNAMYAVALSALAFVSQNLGAGKIKRVREVTRKSLFTVFVVWLAVGGIIFLFRRPLVSIISDNEETIRYAVMRLNILATTYFLCGFMDVMALVMRGLGKSTTSMVVSLSGSCLLRILWLSTVFRYVWTGDILCVWIIYPISWLLTFCVHTVMYLITMRKIERNLSAAPEAQAPVAAKA